AVVPAIIAAGPQGRARAGRAVDGGPVGARRGLARAGVAVRLGGQRRRAEPSGARTAGSVMSTPTLTERRRDRKTHTPPRPAPAKSGGGWRKVGWAPLSRADRA